MTRTELISLIADSVGVLPTALSESTCIKDVPQWDSVAWLMIISAVDERLGFVMKPSEIAELKTVGDLLQYIEEGPNTG